jgi:DNA-binding CsgD family transcriptional regulator
MDCRSPDAGTVARRTELETLRRTLADVAGGQGVVVAVRGPLACGKTALLGAATDRPGVIVLRALCSLEESVLPYGVLGQLTDHEAVTRHAPGLVPLLRVCASAERGGLDAVRLAHDFTRAVLRLAAEQPVTVVIDDLHHADAESLLGLRHLARRAGPAQVALVFTELRQPLPPTSHSAFHTDLLGLPYYQELELRPLRAGDVAELIREQLGQVPDDRFTADFFRASGGNLLLGRGLIHDLRAARAGGPAPGRAIRGELVAGVAFRRAYLGSLYRCGNATVAIARAVAVLAEDADDGLVSRLSGIGPEHTAHVLSMMEESGLLRGLRFPHPEARSAVLEDLPPARRRRLHERALETLRARGADADVLVVHQTGSGRTHGADAVEVYDAAAALARRHGEPGAVVEHLERAYLAADEPETRATLRFRVAMAEWRRDPRLVAPHIQELRASAVAGLLPPRRAVLLALWLVLAGRMRDALDVLRGFRSSLQAWDPVHTTERALSAICPGLSVAGRPDPAEREEPVALPASAESWARVVSAYADALHGRSAQAVAEAERVLDLTDHAVPDPATTGTALFALMYAGDTEAAQAHCDRLTGTAVLGDFSVTADAAVCAARAELAVRRGDLAGAVAAGHAALNVLSLPGWGVVGALPLSSLVVALTRMGRYAEAGHYLEERLPEATDQCVFGLHRLWARGQYNLAIGHSHAAYLDFRICGELMLRWRMDQPGLLIWRVDMAEALLRRDGPTPAGDELLREQLDRAPTGRARGLALTTLAAYRPVRERVDLLEQAIESLRGDRYALARAYTELGEAHAELNHRGKALQMFDAARRLARASGAAPLLARLDAGPGESSREIPARGVAALTDTEARVASLAAAGRTNREIAGQLFVTASTVEQHLTKIFRKLGVRNRRDLPADLAVG